MGDAYEQGAEDNIWVSQEETKKLEEIAVWTLQQIEEDYKYIG
jgi:hypothetical protein